MTDLTKTFGVELTWQQIPTYGDLMWLPDFLEAVRSGLFTDYDGTGYYAVNDRMSNKKIHPSEIHSADRRFTHVVWFNR